jgi:parallel beta-helix repeat protein
MLNKTAKTSLLFFIMLISWTAQHNSLASQNPRTIKVPANFASIQEAIDATSAGDTVLVASGLYNECIVIDKPLRLVGEDRNNTVIDGGSYNFWGPVTRVVSVLSENVTIEGFTIRNAFYGIYADHSDFFTVRNNIFTSNFRGLCVNSTFVSTVAGNIAVNNIEGITVENSSMCAIEYNVLANNWGGYPDLLVGAGISLYRSNSSMITNNFLTNHTVGAIMLGEAYRNIIGNNTTTKNDAYAVELYTSCENLVVNNTSTEDGGGIRVTAGSKNNVVIGNFASTDIIGIGCSFSEGNVFAQNTLSNNTDGFAMEQASNLFVGNLIVNNSNGIGIHFSNGSIFHHNNFVNNTVDVPEDVYANFNVWDDGFEGNYWDIYNGSDTDQDGIGDSPYIIDQYNRDNHPLMGMFSNFTFPWQEQKHPITTISNSTITNFQFNSTLKTVSFSVTGETQTIGFCRVTIPNTIVQEMWNNNYTVLIDNREPLMIRNWTDDKNTFIYLMYQHSQHMITIIPEFPPSTLLVILIPTIIFAITKKKRAPGSHAPLYP